MSESLYRFIFSAGVIVLASVLFVLPPALPHLSGEVWGSTVTWVSALYLAGQAVGVVAQGYVTKQVAVATSVHKESRS